MNRLLFASLVLLGGLLLTGGAARAQTHTITFDTDAAGIAINEGDIISEQYAAWGVHFEANVFGGTNYTGTNFADNTGMTATASDFSFPPGATATVSGNLLHSLTDWFNENGDPSFWLRFDQPVIDVSLDAYGVGSAFAVYGFDGELNLLSATPTDLFISGGKRLTLADPGLGGYYYVGITGDFNGWTGVDNIRFTSVPEPGSLTLLAGIAIPGGLFLLSRRYKHSCR